MWLTLLGGFSELAVSTTRPHGLAFYKAKCLGFSGKHTHACPWSTLLARDRNIVRSLAEVVSVDGWFDVIEEDDRRFTLHVDAVFSAGRFGGEDESPVRFRLRLRRAEIVVIISENSVLRVDKSSVDRTAAGGITRKVSVETSTEAAMEADAGATVKTGFFAGVKGRIAARRTRKERSEQEETVRVIQTQSALTGDGHYCWRLSPFGRDWLNGPVWNPREEPRFTVIDRRSGHQKSRDKDRAFSPQASIEIRCKREDIEIRDIAVKDKKANADLHGRRNQAVRIAAAEGHIREMLLREGLAVGDLNEAFAEFVLADLLVPLD